MTVCTEKGIKKYFYEGSELQPNEVFHIPQKWSYDGIIGHDIHEGLHSIFQVSDSMETYTKNSFSGFIGKRLKMKLTNIANKTDEQLENMKDVFAAKYGGDKNAGKALLELPGTEFGVLDTGTVDERVRWLKENAAYCDERVAKYYGYPLPLLNGTYQNNIEEIFSILTETAIRPICQHIAESFMLLLDPKDRPFMYFEHDFNILMKTNLSSRIDAYTKQIGWGIFSPNEVLEKENRPGFGPAGDTHFIPANLMPLTEENVKAYMGKAKQAVAAIGDDKL